MDPNEIRQNIIENYKNPEHYGVLEKYSHKSKYSNLSCGDEIEVFLKIENDLITEISFIGSGCSIAIATMSMLTSRLIGQPASFLKNLEINYLQNEILGLQLSPARYRCALIGVQALKKAMEEQ
jgi:nitrogen fixation NifU-like protein